MIYLNPAIRLLGTFVISNEHGEVALSNDAERLVAFLAVQGVAVDRSYVAGTLWSECATERADGSLRSALWRVRRECPDLIEFNSGRLAIASSAASDLQFLEEAARQLRLDVCPEQLVQWDQKPLGRELLPGWYEDWVLIARERFRQLSLHTLESIANRLCAESMFSTAVQAALGAICLDPLRESAHRCLISIYIAEGNPAEALRVQNSYAALLHSELGLEPSAKMTDLMRGIYSHH